MISIDAATKQMNMEVSDEELRCRLLQSLRGPSLLWLFCLISGHV